MALPRSTKAAQAAAITVTVVVTSLEHNLAEYYSDKHEFSKLQAQSDP